MGAGQRRARRAFRVGAPDPAQPPAPNPPEPALPDDATVEAKDQQYLDNTCGCRVVVESLALAGVITPDQQQGLALELWNYEHPGVSPFAPGTGTTVQQVAVLLDYCRNKYGVAIGYRPLGMDVNALVAALDADDQNGQVHMLDSCRSVDATPDVFTPQQLMNCAGAFFPQCGWIIEINGHTSVCIAVDLGMLLPRLGIAPGRDYHWLLSH